MDRWLLVINRRDGNSSVVGKISGHWPEDVLRVSHYYSPGFIDFVARHKQLFKRLWGQGGIEVYEINPG
jgi:hypothetical protein